MVSSALSLCALIVFLVGYLWTTEKAVSDMGVLKAVTKTGRIIISIAHVKERSLCT
jgi:hypothetical protein